VNLCNCLKYNKANIWNIWKTH